jgi:hypothetical protein
MKFNATSLPKLPFRTSQSCLDRGGMSTGLAREVDHPNAGTGPRTFAAKQLSTYSCKIRQRSLQTSSDEKMPGQHPKALYLNGSEVGHETGREQVEATLGGEFAICGCQRGPNCVGRLEIGLCWVPSSISLERSNFIPWRP